MAISLPGCVIIPGADEIGEQGADNGDSQDVGIRE
jgi:hypothetical protein